MANAKLPPALPPMSYALPSEDTAPRILFRVNGEAARLDVADAILRPFFEALKLGGQWGCTLGALRYCKNVRNQYAHCNWHSDEQRHLCFHNMDRDADSRDEILNVHLYPTDLDLLQKQHQYFEYTLDWVWYLTCECRKHKGQASPTFQFQNQFLNRPCIICQRNPLQRQQSER